MPLDGGKTFMLLSYSYGYGALGKMDLDLVRSAWEYDRLNNVACNTGDLSADQRRCLAELLRTCVGNLT